MYAITRRPWLIRHPYLFENGSGLTKYPNRTEVFITKYGPSHHMWTGETFKDLLMVTPYLTDTEHVFVVRITNGSTHQQGRSSYTSEQ